MPKILLALEKLKSRPKATNTVVVIPTLLLLLLLLLLKILPVNNIIIDRLTQKRAVVVCLVVRLVNRRLTLFVNSVKQQLLIDVVVVVVPLPLPPPQPRVLTVEVEIRRTARLRQLVALVEVVVACRRNAFGGTPSRPNAP